MTQTHQYKLRAQQLRSDRAPSEKLVDLSGVESLEQLADDEETVACIVDCFYDRLLASSQLSMHFRNVDTARLRLHQSHFMIQLLSGAYKGKVYTLRAIHKRLVDNFNLDQSDFDEFTRLVVNVLQGLSLNQGLIDDFCQRIEVLREWILGLPQTYRPMTLDELFESGYDSSSK